MVFITVFTFYHGTTAVQGKVKYGHFWSKERSVFYHVTKDHFDFKNLGFLLIRVVGSLFAFTNTYLISRTAQIADMSPALAYSFSSINMFFVALIFYIAYKEMIGIKLFIGMLLVVAAVILVAISRT
jgi:drug/metabolite transporter (DMT)-like permease